eukprot:snap_masked-scaffold38_size502422-processed-gene-1.10 protein:Tk05866 transcript:snap_masked-scaffold38_size502422-processed-gene-1.10-mRNA-1 annotation:"hypothetical protein BRAFLDRAFT_60314"
MSHLNDLLRGDCGGQSALTQVSSHFKSGSVLQEGTRTRFRPGRTAEDELVHEFLSTPQRSLGANGAPSFRMDAIMADLRGHPVALGARPKQARRAEQWADHFAAERVKSASQARTTSSEWARDFERLEPRKVSQQPDPAWVQDFLRDDLPILREETTRDEELSKIADQVFVLAERDDRLIAQAEAQARVLSEIGTGDSILIDGNHPRQTLKGPEPLASKSEEWAEEFSEFTDEDFSKLDSYNQDYWHKLEDQWKEMANNEEAEWAKEFEDTMSGLETYEFKEDNPLLDHPNALEEGRAKLAQGDIPSAALLFEAAVQNEPDNAEAWTLLGTTQAKNDFDHSALAALKKAVALDPAHSVARMALAVAFANESYQTHACQALQDWIQHHPQYSKFSTGNATSNTPVTSSFMTKDLHDRTSAMFLNAVRSGGEATVDPDLQTGLGVLFHLSEDYDKAVDCFKTALKGRPEDALLWNKLGASLANGNRSEEAVSAYHHALSFSPGFIKTRFNLGISCVNLKSYREATEHFLAALNFQAAGRGPQGTQTKAVMSDSIWSSLRFCLSLMERKDLYKDVDERNLERLNQILSQS